MIMKVMSIVGLILFTISFVLSLSILFFEDARGPEAILRYRRSYVYSNWFKHGPRSSTIIPKDSQGPASESI